MRAWTMSRALCASCVLTRARACTASELMRAATLTSECTLLARVGLCLGGELLRVSECSRAMPATGCTRRRGSAAEDTSGDLRCPCAERSSSATYTCNGSCLGELLRLASVTLSRLTRRELPSSLESRPLVRRLLLLLVVSTLAPRAMDDCCELSVAWLWLPRAARLAVVAAGLTGLRRASNMCFEKLGERVCGLDCCPAATLAAVECEGLGEAEMD